MEDREKWLWRQINKNGIVQTEFVQLNSDDLQWNRAGVEIYIGQVVEFCEKLLMLMHFTDGQPARAPEILSVRHCNTMRGLVLSFFRTLTISLEYFYVRKCRPLIVELSARQQTLASQRFDDL